MSGPIDVMQGTWLLGQLMDWCRARRVHPAEYNDLFAIVTRAHDRDAAVAALVDAAVAMRDCLQIMRDDCMCEPDDLIALQRGDAALDRIGAA